MEKITQVILLQDGSRVRGRVELVEFNAIKVITSYKEYYFTEDHYEYTELAGIEIYVILTEEGDSNDYTI